MTPDDILVLIAWSMGVGYLTGHVTGFIRYLINKI